MQFSSDRIRSAFDVAVANFKRDLHDSRIANVVVDLLMSSEGPKRYAEGGRNDCVKRLAEDAEAKAGLPANLLFRTPGSPHDALQNLIDEYWNAVDGIYYPAAHAVENKHNVK
jgi:hypothetical protein